MADYPISAVHALEIWMVLYDHDDMRYYKIAHPLAVRQFDVVSSSRNYLSKPQKAFIESISSYYHPYL